MQRVQRWDLHIYQSAARISGISWSVRPGMTGATRTPAGIPASVSFRIASSLRSVLSEASRLLRQPGLAEGADVAFKEAGVCVGYLRLD